MAEQRFFSSQRLGVCLAAALSVALWGCEQQEDDCYGVGGGFSGKERDAHCCRGLKQVSDLEPDAGLPRADGGDRCGFSGAVDALICLACGDGVCDHTVEQFCNCPEDCPPPP